MDVSLEPGYNRFKPSSGKAVNLGYMISIDEVFKVSFRKNKYGADLLPFLGNVSTRIILTCDIKRPQRINLLFQSKKIDLM